MSIPMVCESARDCIIEKLNFVIKILYGVTILVETKCNDFYIPYGWCMICSILDEITYMSIEWSRLNEILT